MSELWKPRKYHITCVSHIISTPRGGLFADPGLGKTSSTLMAYNILKLTGETMPMLVIAPLRVCYNTWPAEIAKWTQFKNLNCRILHGKGKSGLWDKNVDIFIINPEGLDWLYKELLKNINSRNHPFDMLVIDESTKFKNHKTKRFKILKTMASLFKRVNILTGTPVATSMLDLWSQMYLVDGGDSLGESYYKFRSVNFWNKDNQGFSWELRPESESKIMNCVKSKILDLSHDVLDMPPIIYNNIKVTLPPIVMAKYRKLENDLSVELAQDEVVTAQSAMLKSQKCHQLANGQVYIDPPEDLDEVAMRDYMRTRKGVVTHTAKLDALSDLIDELQGKPILVAYSYKHDLATLRERFDAPYIGGGVGSKQTAQIIDRWNNGDIPVLLGHPISMAHGLNMQQSANDICWYSLPWSTELYIQFNARIFRQGVVGGVRVHHLVSAKTIDEVMIKRLGFRAKTQSDFRKGLREYLTIRGM